MKTYKRSALNELLDNTPYKHMLEVSEMISCAYLNGDIEEDAPMHHEVSAEKAMEFYKSGGLEKYIS